MLPATAPGAAADGPGRPHSGLEAHLVRLFTRGRELAGTLIRQEVDILTGPAIMQLALGAFAVYNLRPSDCTPVEEVNILRALEGGLHKRAHNGVPFTYHGFSWRTLEGVFSSSALRRIETKMISLESLFRKLGPPRGETVTRSFVEWWLLGCFAGEDDTAMDAQWFEHLRASATAMEPPRDGADDGPAWVPVDSADGEGHHQMFRRVAERPLRETSRRELP